MNLEENKKKSSRFERLRNKFRLVAIDPLTFHEKWSVRVSWFNIISVLGLLSILVGMLTTVLLIFTPIGGAYGEFTPKHKKLALENIKWVEEQQKLANIGNYRMQILKKILQDSLDFNEMDTDSLSALVDQIKIEEELEVNDSAFRENYEQKLNTIPKQISGIVVVPPATGKISKKFNPDKGHFGVDLSTGKEEPVKACLKGTVIMKEWSSDDGHVLVLAHGQNLLSIYKHNSETTVNEGQVVSEGQVIAISGNTGSTSSGPHLHFEIWDNGVAINPEVYFSFE